jgi:Ca2+-transporting ATPase
VDGDAADPASRREIVHDALRAEEDAWTADTQARQGSFTRALIAACGDVLPALDPRELLDARSPRPDAPFSRTRARRNGGIEELALGAPEAVLELGDHPDDERWRTVAESAAGSGKRLLLLARRVDAGPWSPTALLSFADTLRPGIREALAEATTAGIHTIVVTGDHPSTASMIAREAGLGGESVVTGSQLEEMSDDEVADALAGLEVVARATPEQKLRLVLAAKRTRRTVAVTGDGVNDAPALQQADVGVAMGSGTAVAREAADLVLGDDSFATLMDGLREGRRIVANVQKGLVFLTSTHVALLGFILIATLAGFGQPLLPIQILWLELFIDLSSSIAFEREPPEPDVMRVPPRPRDRPLLTRELLTRVAVAGGVTAFAALGLMSWHGGGFDHARWLAFTALVYAQLVRAYANRSLVHPVRTLPVNGFLLVVCASAAVIQLVIPYIGPLAAAFRATPLDPLDLALVAIIAVVPALVAELVRTGRRMAWVA